MWTGRLLNRYALNLTLSDFELIEFFDHQQRAQRKLQGRADIAVVGHAYHETVVLLSGISRRLVAALSGCIHISLHH